MFDLSMRSKHQRRQFVIEHLINWMILPFTWLKLCASCLVSCLWSPWGEDTFRVHFSPSRVVQTAYSDPIFALTTRGWRNLSCSSRLLRRESHSFDCFVVDSDFTRGGFSYSRSTKSNLSSISHAFSRHHENPSPKGLSNIPEQNN